jgi:hypothetical protein
MKAQQETMVRHALAFDQPVVEPCRARRRDLAIEVDIRPVGENKRRPGSHRGPSTMPPAGGASAKASIPRKRTWWARPSVPSITAEASPVVMQSGADEAPDDRRRCRVGIDHVVGDTTILTAFGEGPVHGFDDVAPHAEIAQDRLGFKTNHPLAWPSSRGETHALQLLQSADGETRLRIALARIVRPQVDEAAVIGRHPDRRVEARPTLCAERSQYS